MLDDERTLVDASLAQNGNQFISVHYQAFGGFTHQLGISSSIKSSGGKDRRNRRTLWRHLQKLGLLIILFYHKNHSLFGPCANVEYVDRLALKNEDIQGANSSLDKLPMMLVLVLTTVLMVPVHRVPLMDVGAGSVGTAHPYAVDRTGAMSDNWECLSAVTDSCSFIHLQKGNIDYELIHYKYGDFSPTSYRGIVRRSVRISALLLLAMTIFKWVILFF